MADIIAAREHQNIKWICDSNIYIAPTDQVVWDALLSRDERLVVTPTILNELKQWLTSPSHNQQIATIIRDASNSNNRGKVKRIDVPGEGMELLNGMHYYVNLLGKRKEGQGVLDSLFQEEHGRKPSNQELSNYLKDKVGPRAQYLAKSGATAKVAENKFNDEAIIVQTVTESLRTGRSLAILTRDEGMYDQFYKMLWILDTHYRSMLMAAHYAANPLSFYPVSRITDWNRWAFEGEVILIEKPSDLLEEYLPRFYEPVVVYCFHLKDASISYTSFQAERLMLRVLQLKGKTTGLSTDLLDQRNLHVYLGPLIRDWGDRAAIGRDIMAGPPGQTRFALVDLNLVLSDCEPVVHIREVPPQLILLPTPPRIISPW